MEDKPCTSKEANKLHQGETKRWTRDLKLLPPFTYGLLQKHLQTEPKTSDNSTGAHKHKKLGYQMFKDKYVRQVEIKADVKKDNGQPFYLMKGCVNASMKKNSYVVYIHLNQITGEVVYANCVCKGGCCKHVVAMLFQIIKYVQLELTEVPDDLTCTQLLQQWHVPRNDELNEPILYEDVIFEKASYEKDTSGKKCKTLKREAPDNVYNPTPHFARETSQQKFKEFVGELKQLQKANYLWKLLDSNDCQPFPFEEVHSNLSSKKRCTESKGNVFNLNESNIRDQTLESLKPAAVNRPVWTRNILAL